VNFSAIRDKVAAQSIRLVPTAVYSEVIGWGARATIPAPMRPAVYAGFAHLVGAPLGEVELPLREYPSMGSFFARRLRAGARTVVHGEDVAVSPCDGRVASAGTVGDGRVIQAKGRTYTLAQLLVDAQRAAGFDAGACITVYLSPSDYHRVHAPCAGEVLGYDYVPGRLLPVGPRWAACVPGLFARNERMVLHLQTTFGRVALVMVGAAGVGNMAIAFDVVHARDFRAARSRAVRRVRYDPPRPQFERGDELGWFELGSTVVLVFEPGRVQLAPLGCGVRVRFGEPIGCALARGEAGR